MKNIIIPIILVFVLTTQARSAEKETILKDRIKNVTVFMQNAQIFKEANALIPKGTSTLIFNNVSPQIHKASLQASGNGNFTILNTQYRYHASKESVKKKEIPSKLLIEINKLNDSIYINTLRISKNKELIQAIDKEKNLVLGHRLVNGTTKSDSLELLMGTAAFLRKELKELAQMQLILTIKAKTLQGHQNKLRTKLNSLNAMVSNMNIQPNNIYEHQVLVTIFSKVRTEGKVKLNYLTNQAGWTPQYDLKATDHQTDITLLYKAQVYQNTGEDWNQVKVKISNANPQIGNTKPTLPTWYINFARFTKKPLANRKYYIQKERSTSPVAAMEVEDMALDEKADMLTTYTNKVQNFSSVEFDINIKLDIKSNGLLYYLDLKKEKLKTKFQLYLVPKLNKDAFVVANLSGWESLDLLTGPANIYYGNTFVGTTVLDPSILEDTLAVSMGRDRSIYVERKKLKSSTKQKLIGSSKIYTADYSIIIKNKNKGNINLIIEDHIPVSKNEKIEITSEEKDGILNNTNGMISWNLDLEAYQKKELSYSYSIKYPKEESIIL